MKKLIIVAAALFAMSAFAADPSTGTTKPTDSGNANTGAMTKEAPASGAHKAKTAHVKKPKAKKAAPADAPAATGGATQ